MGVSGLAASIREASESEIFDLGGQTVSTIMTTIQHAFAEPFEFEEHMIRITFITGAGKGARQKYDDGAARAVTSVLSSLGYVEDRAASCVLECAGCFKLQHDTGKNLKTVVVFPKFKNPIKDLDNAANGTIIEPILPLHSPGYKLAISSMGVFQNMLKAKCPSWSQKRNCLECVEEIQKLIDPIDQQLMNAITPLTPSEQAFYDAVLSLEEKQSFIRQELFHHVEMGHLITFELQLLLEQNVKNIATLTQQGKPTTKALQRKERLQSVVPLSPHALKYEAELSALRKERLPLLKLEKEARGRLLTLKETQTLARKVEIDDELEYLEQASRGWFEDDAFFQSRVQASRIKFETKQQKKMTAFSKSISIGADTKLKVSTKWLTPQEQKAWAKKQAEKMKRRKERGASAFSSMVMDSSSSDEDDDDEDDDNDDDDDDLPLDVTTAAGAKRKKRKKKKFIQEHAEPSDVVTTTMSRQIMNVLSNSIFPLLLALLTWLVSLVFGKPKKAKRT